MTYCPMLVAYCVCITQPPNKHAHLCCITCYNTPAYMLICPESQSVHSETVASQFKGLPCFVQHQQYKPLSGCCVACSDPTGAGFQEEEVLWVLEAPCGGHGNPGWRRGNRGVAAVELSIWGHNQESGQRPGLLKQTYCLQAWLTGLRQWFLLVLRC